MPVDFDSKIFVCIFLFTIFAEPKQSPFGGDPKNGVQMEMKDRILHIMKEAGMSQAEFSKATGIPAASLSSIFTGRTAPTMKHAEAIHRYCPTLSISWLLFGEGEMHPNASGESLSDGSDVESGSDTHPLGQDGLFAASDSEYGDSSQSSQAASVASYSPTSRIPQSQYVRAREAGKPFSDPAVVRAGMSRSPHADILPNMYANAALDAANNPYKSNRKIVEIRIFFDDGTFETFGGN